MGLVPEVGVVTPGLIAMGLFLVGARERGSQEAEISLPIALLCTRSCLFCN